MFSNIIIKLSLSFEHRAKIKVKTSFRHKAIIIDDLHCVAETRDDSELNGDALLVLSALSRVIYNL